jgi:proteasome lid subunit RPN8/RPN11
MIEILVTERETEERERSNLRANFRTRLQQALGRTRRDDFEILQRLESVLRCERREHFFLVAYRDRALFVFHALGNENTVSFDRDALVRWLDEVDPDDAFAVHSHPQPSSSVYPSRPDREMTKELLSLEPIREHYIVLPSEDEIRFTIYCFTQRTTKVLECAEEHRELRAARKRRR